MKKSSANKEAVSNYSVSAASVRALFRLELRARFGSKTDVSKRDKWSKASNIIFSLIIYGVLVFGIYELTNIFVLRSGLGYEYLVIATTATMVIETIIATGSVIKNLYMKGDNELLLRFPVTGAEILIAKSIYCFLQNLIVCFALMLPFYVCFGALSPYGVSKAYYVEAIIDVLLASFVPILIANIIAVPVMQIVNKIKNQHLLILVILIVLVCAVFIVYMEILKTIMKYMQDNSATLFSADMIARYQRFAVGAYPFKWYANMLSGTTLAHLDNSGIGLSFLYVVLMTIGLGVIAFFTTVKLYYKTILKGIEGEKASFKHKTHMNVHTPFEAMLRREFLLIFRSFNYSFQYLALAVAAPLMVYYCNDLAIVFGTESVGGKIVPGLTLMVIVLFSTIIVSFAATTISREGNEFYMTKTIPVSFAGQVSTKFFLYAIVGVLSVSLSSLVAGLAFGPTAKNPVCTATDIAAIWGISEMMTLALTCLAIFADVKSPTFNVSGDGEMVQANKNIALSLFVGIASGLIFGLFAMVFNFVKVPLGNLYLIENVNDAYAILAGVSAIILVVSAVLLWVNLNKRYTKIVP